MRIARSLIRIAEEAKSAARKLRLATSAEKNAALEAIADALEQATPEIMQANQQDLQAASGLSEPLRERLSLEGRLSGIISDVRRIVALPDPVGEVLEAHKLKNGLRLEKRRVPIGVIGIIYESRPNVTVDCAALTLKTNNCAILRGGKETLHTNCALIQALQKALSSSTIPPTAVQLIQSPHRSQVKQLIRLDQYIDMIIPRGGEGLHRFCRESGTIPVITGGMGICHLFVAASAHPTGAIEVIFNAKTQRPSVCNALDTLLLDAAIAPTLLPPLLVRLATKKVHLRVDGRTAALIRTFSPETAFQLAEEKDWHTEWMNLTLGIKIVDSLEEAIGHIHTYSTQHSDGILTENTEQARLFVNAVDSAAVYVNASTRFTDGGEFGLGAEVAVSTQKLHARGPMGLKELTTYKWICTGDYHVRE